VPGQVIYLVRSWPRMTQTFVLDEVLAVERLGTPLAIYSLVRSPEPIVQPEVMQVRAPVRFLDVRPPAARLLRAHGVVLAAAPVRYLRTLLLVLTRPRLASGYATCSATRCFAHAVRVAADVGSMRRAGSPPRHLHAHFAHDPALVAMLVHRLTGLPYSLTAHARDLYQIPPESLRARVSYATAAITCCQANADYMTSVLPSRSAGRVRVVHHGVELDRFPAKVARGPEGPLALLSVGRLVEKKGLADLLQACARLAASGREFTCQILGDGPMRDPLLQLRDQLGLAHRVELPGARPRHEILAALRASDIFVLTPYVPADGDRDGIPNVLVEAMACGLPVVSTAAGGVTELVQHDHNGLVAQPRDVEEIARQLDRLLLDADLRHRLGTAGRRTVEAGYDVDAAARALTTLFR
jgi:glycosyltransferase involved in cell wall biosynthesis